MNAYEIAFKNAMGDYTTRTCDDVYRNIYVNSNCRKLCDWEKDLLNQIFIRSDKYSKNPFIFGWKEGEEYKRLDIYKPIKLNDPKQNHKIEKKIELDELDLLEAIDTNTKTTMATYTTTIITAEQYKNGIQKETGTLMFGDKYYDMLSYMDMKVLRKKFGMRKEQRIKAVVVMTKEHTDFKNVANLDLPLRYAVFCDKDDVGAEWANFGGMYSHKHPLGDAFVVVNKL